MLFASGRSRLALLIVVTLLVTTVLYARFYGPEPGASSPVIALNDMQQAAGTLRDGVLTVALEARAGEWYPDGPDGAMRAVAAFAVPGRRLQNPGPLIRVRAGTQVRVSVRNTLDRQLTLFGLGEQRGIMTDSAIIEPGASRDLEFRANEPGVYYYMGKTTPVPTLARSGEDSQLNGVIVVDPAEGPLADDEIFVISGWFDADSTTVSGLKQGSVLTINGREWPHAADRGDAGGAGTLPLGERDDHPAPDASARLLLHGGRQRRRRDVHAACGGRARGGRDRVHAAGHDDEHVVDAGPARELDSPLPFRGAHEHARPAEQGSALPRGRARGAWQRQRR
jgi:hypothetical protein